MDSTFLRTAVEVGFNKSNTFDRQEQYSKDLNDAYNSINQLRKTATKTVKSNIFTTGMNVDY